jgi:hypothetical protein
MKRIVISIGLLLCFLTSSAQTPVFWYDVDLVYLEALVMQRVDALRQEQGLPELRSESHLQKAAQRQAAILASEQLRGQQRDTPKVKDPGLKFSTPQQVSMNVALNRWWPTYEQTADSILSRLMTIDHGALLNPDHQIAGLKIVQVEGTNSLLTVQQYASAAVNQQWIAPRSYLKQIDTDQLPYKLKPYQRDEVVNELVKLSAIGIKNKQLGSMNPEAIKALFKHRKDGIAFEVVLNGQGRCNSEVYEAAYNRRNDNSSINGRVYFPIYKKELLKDIHFKVSKASFLKDQSARLRRATTARNRFKNKYANTKSRLRSVQVQKLFSSARSRPSRQKLKEQIGKLAVKKTQEEEVMKMLKSAQKSTKKEKWEPIHWDFALPKEHFFAEDAIVEVNILLLRKNRVAYAMYYGQLDGEGSFKDSLQATAWVFDKPQIVLKPKRKVLHTDIAFKRNETSVNSVAFERFKLGLEDYLIDTISLTAFASIEGSKAGNERLFEQRADSLYHSLQAYHSSEVVFTHEMRENWDMFYDQIANDDKFQTWKSLSKDSIRQLLGVHGDEQPWEGYLNDQRSAKVRVSIHENIADTIAYLKKHYDLKDVNEQKLVLDFLINESLELRLSPSYVKKMRYHRDSAKYAPHILSKYLFEFQYNMGSDDFDLRTFSRRFLKNINVRRASTALLNAYLELLVSHWDACKPAVPNNYILFSELVSRGISNRAMAIFALRAMDHYQQYFDQPKAKYYYQYVGAEQAVDQLPNFIYDFYITDSTFTSSRDRYLQLAQMFIKCDKVDLAYNLLQDYQDKHHYDVAFKSLQLKMSYTHPFNDRGAFVQELIRQYDKMPNDKWCGLFEGAYPISFQSKDWAELRVLYCEECRE